MGGIPLFLTLTTVMHVFSQIGAGTYTTLVHLSFLISCLFLFLI